MNRSRAAYIDDFAFDLLRQLAPAGDTTNVFYSPLSVTLALAMACNGARGDTQREITRALRVANLDLATVNADLARLSASLGALDPQVELDVANSLWAAPGMPLRASYARDMAASFQAELRNIVFDDQGLNTINAWVERQTKDRIRHLLTREACGPETALILLNAIYFKGRWSQAFDPQHTRAGEFSCADGRKRKARLMTLTGQFAYGEDEHIQAVRLPYGDRRVSMLVVLPRPALTLDALIEGLDAARWSTWNQRCALQTGQVALPRFKVEHTVVLNRALAALGMRRAFGPQADFTGMVSVGNLRISTVLHKAFVEVNEQGTEAAAATAVMMARTMFAPRPPFEFIADRPFLYVIQDDFTGVMLFAGVVREP